MNTEQYVIYLPYMETSRMFNASSSRMQEAFAGESDVVYYKHQAKVFESTSEALREIKTKWSGNVHATIAVKQ